MHHEIGPSLYYFLLSVYTGECWSGPEVAGTFAQDGLSNKCVGKEYDDCDPNVHRTCAGKNRANAVYSI